MSVDKRVGRFPDFAIIALVLCSLSAAEAGGVESQTHRLRSRSAYEDSAASFLQVSATELGGNASVALSLPNSATPGHRQRRTKKQQAIGASDAAVVERAAARSGAWTDLLRRATATRTGDSGSAVGFILIIVVVCVIIVAFLFTELFGRGQDDDLKESRGRSRMGLGRVRPGGRTPLASQEEVRPVTQANATQANAPPSSMKGRFIQQAPESGSFDQLPPGSLQPAGTLSRQGSFDMARNSPGRNSPNGAGSPKLASIERVGAGSLGVTPLGSGSNLPPAHTGAIVSAQPSDSYGSDSVTAVGKPPPVCKELVLPHCEAWFAVAFDKLDNVENGDFDLYGLSGKPLLRASIQSTGKRKGRIGISMKPPKSPTLGTISTTEQMGASGVPIMQIKAKNDAYYGDLICQGDMRFVLTRGQGNEVLRIVFDREQNQLNLSSTVDNSSLACASRCVTSEFNELFADVVHLEVRVNPGVDAVLSLLCVIGVVIFSSHGEAASVHMPQGPAPSHDPGIPRM